MRRTGIWDCAGHPVGTYWRLQPNDADKYHDHRPGLFLQQAGVQHGVLVHEHGGGWWNAGEIVTSRLVQTPGKELRVDALPQVKHGELQDHHQHKSDPNNWHISLALHLGPLAGLGGGPDTLPGTISHSVRGPK